MKHFNHQKALETVLYIAQHVPDAGFHKVSKVLYFADRQHLENYGRFICGDRYIAMQHGPVPSGIYDMLKALRNGSEWHPHYGELRQALNVFENYKLQPLRDANLERLSDSDRQCLNASIDKFGCMSFGELTTLSHDEAYESADFNDEINIEVIARTLAGGDEIVQHLRNPYPDGH
jgi:uncharacterized phage-associated protein